MKRKSEHILSEWLVINAQMGDNRALSQLYTLWQPKLLRYAKRQLGHTGQAEDIVQNVFELMLKKINGVKDPAAFPSWIYQILHRQCVNTIRKLQRDRHNTEQDTLEHEAQHKAASHHQYCENTEKVHFENALASLSPQQYSLVHLFYLEGLSIAEISKTLDVAAGTVKSRLHSARKSLKPKLEEPDNG